MVVLFLENTDVLSRDIKNPIAHCISRDCKMGAGFARTLTDKYPYLRESVRSQKPKMCKVYTSSMGDGRVILNMITKPLYYTKPTKIDFILCLEELECVVDKGDYKVISMPFIGTGLDRLPNEFVKQELERVFGNKEVIVEVCLL